MSDRGIYPSNLADKLRGCGKSYRPSSGSEGDIFYNAYCVDCKRELEWREKKDGGGCEIYAATLFYDTTDPEYPKAWTYDEHGQPTCTAFEEIDAP